MITETLKEIGVMTPDGYKVPKGNLAFLVTAYDPNGGNRQFFSDISPTNPSELKDDVFKRAPEAVDYTFKQVDPRYVRTVGKIIGFIRSVDQLLAITIRPESIQLELKKDS